MGDQRKSAGLTSAAVTVLLGIGSNVLWIAPKIAYRLRPRLQQPMPAHTADPVDEADQVQKLMSDRWRWTFGPPNHPEAVAYVHRHDHYTDKLVQRSPTDAWAARVLVDRDGNPFSARWALWLWIGVAVDAAKAATTHMPPDDTQSDLIRIPPSLRVPLDIQPITVRPPHQGDL
jgi:hypothetical protein